MALVGGTGGGGGLRPPLSWQGLAVGAAARGLSKPQGRAGNRAQASRFSSWWGWQTPRERPCPGRLGR